MKNFHEQFKGKKITVMGLGLLGRGIGDVRFLARAGAELIVTDLKSKEELASSLEELAEFPHITYVLGEHRLEDFRDRDMILKAAGVPIDSLYIAEARAHNIPVEMSAALFARLSGIPIIGVTGTRGKSTVTHLIHHVLSQATEEKVLLGGNVRGVSNLALFDEVNDDSLAVMELDSWQLQGFGEAKISPKISVFTNFMDDHLNYYGGDRDAYFADKAQIFLHQDSGDTFVTTPAVLERAEAYAKSRGATFPQEVVLVDDSLVPEEWTVPIPGEHNRLNVALALAALRATSLPDELIRVGIETFPGVAGRLEFIGERKGVKIYNDNNATTPEATIAALKAVSDGRNIVLIMGGSAKGTDMEKLFEMMPEYVKDIVFLPGTGTDAVKKYAPQVPVAASMKEAVEMAAERAEDGDVLLFSPGFASFGLFKNEYDRGDQFIEAIRALP